MDELVKIGRNTAMYQDIKSHNYIARCTPLVLVANQQLDLLLCQEEYTKRGIREIVGEKE